MYSKVWLLRRNRISINDGSLPAHRFLLAAGWRFRAYCGIFLLITANMGRKGFERDEKREIRAILENEQEKEESRRPGAPHDLGAAGSHDPGGAG